MPSLEFLGWDRPFLGAAADWLLERKTELPGMLVVVPTAQSGRRLRETLAEADGSILAPEVVTPGALLAVDSPEVAPEWIERVAWAEVLESVPDWSPFEALFPEIPGEGKGWAAGLADEMTRLRRSLQENGHLFQSAARALAGSPDADRWKALADLETRVEAQLVRWRWKSRSRELSEGLRLDAHPHIVLAGVPEMPPLLAGALESFNGRLEILVAAPADLAGRFSLLGQPTEDWNEVRLPWPASGEGSVRLAADPRQQAAEALDAVAAGGLPSPEIALGSADAETGAELQRAFTRAGWMAFQPSAPQSPPGLAKWFRVWSQWLARPTFAVLADLLTLPESAAWVGPRLNRRARQLSRVRDEWMCLDTADLRRRLEGESEVRESLRQDAEEILAAADLLESVRRSLLNRNFAAELKRLLETVGERIESAAGTASQLLVWLDEAAPLMSAMDRSPAYWIELMISELPDPVASPPDGRVIDIQGWLELFHEPGRHLVLCGLNEGNLPSRGGGEPWLAEGVRQRLGMITDEIRSARDAYLFTAMIEARRKGGRVDLICGKTGSGGEALLPSRFLLAAEKDMLPARVKSLFRGVEPPEAGMRWHADWKWKPRSVAPPEKLHVTSFRDYLKCPFRYYLKHVGGMKRPDPGRTEWNARDFGNIAHAVVEAWGRDEEARDFSKEEAIGAWFSDKLDELVAAQFGSMVPLAVRIQTESLRQRLLWLARQQACERAAGWKIEAVESGLTFPIGGITVSAKIDRIDRHEDGRLRIIDYKTKAGRIAGVDREHRTKVTASLVPPEHLAAGGPAFYDGMDKAKPAEFLWRDLQLPLYASALSKNGSDLPIPCYFRLGATEAEVTLLEWDGFSETDLLAADACAGWIADQISAGVFWPPAEKVPNDDYALLAAGRDLSEMVETPA